MRTAAGTVGTRREAGAVERQTHESTMHLRYDPELDGVYIYLRDDAYAWDRSLDAKRRIDYDCDDQPIGIDLVQVNHGVLLDNLPECEAVAHLLSEHGIASYHHGRIAPTKLTAYPVRGATSDRMEPS